jgi:hypothetical protein
VGTQHFVGRGPNRAGELCAAGPSGGELFYHSLACKQPRYLTRTESQSSLEILRTILAGVGAAVITNTCAFFVHAIIARRFFRAAGGAFEPPTTASLPPILDRAGGPHRQEVAARLPTVRFLGSHYYLYLLTLVGDVPSVVPGLICRFP